MSNNLIMYFKEIERQKQTKPNISVNKFVQNFCIPCNKYFFVSRALIHLYLLLRYIMTYFCLFCLCYFSNLFIFLKCFWIYSFSMPYYTFGFGSVLLVTICIILKCILNIATWKINVHLQLFPVHIWNHFLSFNHLF